MWLPTWHALVNVRTKLATSWGSFKLHLGVRSSEQLLVRGVQGWRLWRSTATLPLETLFADTESHLFGILIMLLPSSCPSCPWTTSLAHFNPGPGPSPGPALLRGSLYPRSSSCPLSMAEAQQVIMPLPLFFLWAMEVDAVTPEKVALSLLD